MRYGLFKVEKTDAKKIWKLTVEQEIVSLKFEVSSLKEQLAHCIRDLKFLGERKKSEHMLQSLSKGFNTSTIPFNNIPDKNDDNKIDFTVHVSAALKNNDIFSVVPRVQPFGFLRGPSTSTANVLPWGGTFGVAYRPTLVTERVPGPFGGTVVHHYHYQSISCMPVYRCRSFEELRLEDYHLRDYDLKKRRLVRPCDTMKVPYHASSRRPIRRFSYIRKDKNIQKQPGGVWNRYDCQKMSPALTPRPCVPCIAPFTPIRDQQTTSTNLFQNLKLKLNPWPSMTSTPSSGITWPPLDSSSTAPSAHERSTTDQSEAMTQVVSKLDKMEQHLTNVNNQLMSLASQVSVMDSRLGPRPPLHDKHSVHFGDRVFSSLIPDNVQTTSEVVDASTSTGSTEIEKNVTSNGATKTTPFNVEMAFKQLPELPTNPSNYIGTFGHFKDKLFPTVATNTDQPESVTTKTVDASTSTGFIVIEKNKTSNVASNTTPLKVDMAVNTSNNLASKVDTAVNTSNPPEKVMNYFQLGAVSPANLMDVSEREATFKPSPEFSEINVIGDQKMKFNDSTASIGADRSVNDESMPLSTTDIEEKNVSIDQPSKDKNLLQNYDDSGSNTKLADKNRLGVDTKKETNPLPTEGENISDSERDFEIIENEELAQEMSTQDKILSGNNSTLSLNNSMAYNDVTEYMEIQLGKKKDEVYEFGFEAKDDNLGVDTSTGSGQEQKTNVDETFRTFVNNLIKETKLKQSSPSVISKNKPEGSKVNEGPSKSPAVRLRVRKPKLP